MKLFFNPHQPCFPPPLPRENLANILHFPNFIHLLHKHVSTDNMLLKCISGILCKCLSFCNLLLKFNILNQALSFWVLNFLLFEYHRIYLFLSL